MRTFLLPLDSGQHISRSELQKLELALAIIIDRDNLLIRKTIKEPDFTLLSDDELSMWHKVSLPSATIRTMKHCGPMLSAPIWREPSKER